MGNMCGRCWRSWSRGHDRIAQLAHAGSSAVRAHLAGSGGDRHALVPLAMFDLGAEARDLTELPFGNNLAYRREAFEKCGCFRTELGPAPGARSGAKILSLARDCF
jgi:hypothetical protein